jgi:hypothetical protein
VILSPFEIDHYKFYTFLIGVISLTTGKMVAVLTKIILCHEYIFHLIFKYLNFVKKNQRICFLAKR